MVLNFNILLKCEDPFDVNFNSLTTRLYVNDFCDVMQIASTQFHSKKLKLQKILLQIKWLLIICLKMIIKKNIIHI